MAHPRIDDRQRRARLVRRHHLGRTAADVMAVVCGVVALHSSDPITPHLAAWARVDGFATADLDRALVQDKTLWRLHAMRRTLFVVPRDEAAIFEVAASRAIAAKERARVCKWVAAEVRARSVERWIAKLEEQVLEVLDDGRPWRTQELSEAIPKLATQVTLGSGKWAMRAPIGSRLLFLMAMDGRIVRTRSAGSWRASQYLWAATQHWFEAGAPEPMEPEQARGVLMQRYLGAHGPATLTDLRWWTGWTVKQVKHALQLASAVVVSLQNGAEGYVLAGDTEPVKAVKSKVALLPGLDSTPMGWKERDWYLGEHAVALFDKNGNIGPSVWLGGRIVGGWASRKDGTIAYRLLEDIGKRAAGRVAKEAAALQTWLDGVSVTPRFRTPLERELSK